jgi:murein DD-endopeptidase MepM/ murein hydrolase activator NlpD
LAIARAGDRLGEVGNSGSSLAPLLHFQIMQTAAPVPLFEHLLPFALKQVRKVVKGERISQAPALLQNGDHLYC